MIVSGHGFFILARPPDSLNIDLSDTFCNRRVFDIVLI